MHPLCPLPVQIIPEAFDYVGKMIPHRRKSYHCIPNPLSEMFIDTDTNSDRNTNTHTHTWSHTQTHTQTHTHTHTPTDTHTHPHKHTHTHTLPPTHSPSPSLSFSTSIPLSFLVSFLSLSTRFTKFIVVIVVYMYSNKKRPFYIYYMSLYLIRLLGLYDSAI